MTTQQLEWAVGTRAAARLAVLKSKLQESQQIVYQRADFAGVLPTIGAVDECPCCGKMVHEGELH